MFGLNNLLATFKEIWVLFLVIALYLGAKWYNDKLDREEEEYYAQQ